MSLNATEWMRAIKSYGGKYAVLTAQAGCGFTLWPSNVALPDGTRLVRELILACVSACGLCARERVLSDVCMHAADNNVWWWYRLTQSNALTLAVAVAVAAAVAAAAVAGRWLLVARYNYTVRESSRPIDLVEEFVTAARAAGITPGIYYIINNNYYLSVSNGVPVPVRTDAFCFPLFPFPFLVKQWTLLTPRQWWRRWVAAVGGWGEGGDVCVGGEGTRIISL